LSQRIQLGGTGVAELFLRTFAIHGPRLYLLGCQVSLRIHFIGHEPVRKGKENRFTRSRHAFRLLRFSWTIGPRLRACGMQVNYRTTDVQLKKNKNGNEDHSRTCHDQSVGRCGDFW